MNRLIFFLALFAALAIGPAHADVDFSEWDANQDEVIDEAEYKGGVENDEIFETWDINDDGILNEDEFGNAFFDMFDMDNDDSLTVAEFDKAVDSFFGEQAVNLSIPRWDGNGDGIISRNEFFQTAGDAELFSLFNENRDEVLEPDELEDGLFEAADRNADDELDEDEFLFDDWGF